MNWLTENWFSPSIPLIVLGGMLLLVPLFVLAHPGGTDSSGCHTCRTNCLDWGLSYGEYHCHNAKSYSQPLDPIRSHYGSGGTGYTEPWPEYNYGYSPPSYPSTPSCPLFSSYNSLSDSCKCNYGYVADGGSCVSGNSYCWNKHGYNSSYDSLSKSCECNYGYVFNSSNQCVSQDNYCQSIFGYNAEYNVPTDKCGCSSGYVADSSGNSCISGSLYCSNKFGFNSRFNSLNDTCECDYGYELSSGQCVKKEVRSYTPPVIPVITPTPSQVIKINTPSPIPIVTPSKPIPAPVPASKPAILPPASIVEPAPVKTKKEIAENPKWQSESVKFNLVGNELLRECGGTKCKVVKWGSTNGTAAIIGKQDDWFKAIISDTESTNEGWLNKALVPDEIQDQYAATIIKQEPQESTHLEEPKKWYSKMFAWIFGIFQ